MLLVFLVRLSLFVSVSVSKFPFFLFLSLLYRVVVSAAVNYSFVKCKLDQIIAFFPIIVVADIFSFVVQWITPHHRSWGMEFNCQCTC